MKKKHTDQEIIVERIRALVSGMVYELVDDTEAATVEVQAIRSSEVPSSVLCGVVFRVQVAQSDVGKIVGKMGRTAKAIRTLLVSMARKHKMNFQLDIVDAGAD